MRRMLRPGFVVTVSAMSSAPLVGCDRKAPDAVDPSGGTHTVSNESPVVDPREGTPTGASEAVITSSDEAAFHVRPTGGSVDYRAYPTALNARDEDGRVVYRGRDSCYIHGEFDEPPTSMRPPPTEAVACPPIMRAAAWSFCTGGSLRADPAGAVCLCSRDGNPPPPPHLQDCPAP